MYRENQLSYLKLENPLPLLGRGGCHGLKEVGATIVLCYTQWSFSISIDYSIWLQFFTSRSAPP